MPGSWWNDWANWLENKRGEMVPAPTVAGGGVYKPIEPAPGSYVKVRISTN